MNYGSKIRLDEHTTEFYRLSFLRVGCNKDDEQPAIYPVLILAIWDEMLTNHLSNLEMLPTCFSSGEQ